MSAPGPSVGKARHRPSCPIQGGQRTARAPAERSKNGIASLAYSRFHLAVSKSLNTRQEAFCRFVAEGCSQHEAYQRAGYTPASDSVADVNASRLLELKPIENVWEYLRANKLAITVFDD
jgi:hypothetical protein